MKRNLNLKIPKLPLPRLTFLQSWRLVITLLILFTLLLITIDVFIFYSYGVGWSKNLDPIVAPRTEFEARSLNEALGIISARREAFGRLSTTSLDIVNRFK